jgi:predicted transcriptional regulator
MSIKISKPTESELDILRFLWQNEQASVREVHEELASKKDVGYTTTLKLMQIMFEKGLVIRDDKSKIHIYKPNVSQETTQQQFLPKFIDTLFSGSSTQLVMQALGNHTPTAVEIDEIQQLLNELKKK